jgi:hypothetical protein
VSLPGGPGPGFLSMSTAGQGALSAFSHLAPHGGASSSHSGITSLTQLAQHHPLGNDLGVSFPGMGQNNAGASSQHDKQ